MTVFAAHHGTGVVLLVLIVLLFGCDAHHGARAFDRDVHKDSATHDATTGKMTDAKAGSEMSVSQTVQAGTLFCLDLYAHLKNQTGNLVFSPWSISSALAMTYAGAGGQTREQMAWVMHFPMEQEAFHAAYALIEQGIAEHAGGENARLMSANALWAQHGYPFHETFLDLMDRYYAAAFYEIDFARSPETARERINSWVEDKTGGKITGLLKPRDIRGDTTLVLSNALYFKGLWAAQFNPEQTREGMFHINNDEQVRVPMMNQQGSFRMIELPGLKILELPYVGEELSMIVVLPSEIDGLAALERRLDARDLQSWIKQVRAKRLSTVQVCLPVFTLKAQYQLGETLSNMGMPLAFTHAADFSGMSADKDIFISDVVHGAVIEIHEEGTEAAASTAVIMTKSVSSARVFAADHPFIFMIRENATGFVLFFARVMSPL